MELNSNLPPVNNTPDLSQLKGTMRVANAPTQKPDDGYVAAESGGGVLHDVAGKLRGLFGHHGGSAPAPTPTPAKEPGAWLSGADGKPEWHTQSDPPAPKDAHGKWVIDTACGSCDWYWAADAKSADAPDGVADAPPPGPSPEVKWTKNISVNGSPLIANGKLYASDSYPDKSLHCYDPATGAELWKRSFSNAAADDESSNGPDAPVAGPDGSLLVAGDDGQLHSLAGDTGQVGWSLPVGAVNSKIRVSDDGKATFCSAGNMVTVDLKSHQIVSKTPLKGTFEEPPVAGKNAIYGGSNNSVQAFDSKTGEQKWSYETGNLVRNSPAIGPDGQVYVGSIDMQLRSLDPDSGQPLWTHPTGGYIIDSPTVGKDNTVYVGSQDNYAYAVDGKTGQDRWKLYCGSELRVSPQPQDDGTVMVTTDNNHILCLDGATGDKKWDYAADSYVASPGASDGNGNYFFGCNNGKLYAIGEPQEKPPEQSFLLSDRKPGAQ